MSQETLSANTAKPLIHMGRSHYGDGRDWFLEHQFGLFIHWGLYAIEGWQEQDIWRRDRKREEYADLMKRFSPRSFDPDAWLDLAESIGMKYLCFTAKHLEGFCLWDTKYSSFKSTNTPFGRDILAEIAEACHRRNFPLCLYYSIVDLHHPAYPHCGRRWEYASSPEGDRPDKGNYMAYLKLQVEELCTKYGTIHGFWWDANPAEWEDATINAKIRELQPGIVINNRGFDSGDFGTPERDWDVEDESTQVFDQPVEACQSLGSQSWGYRFGEDYYTDKHLIRSIARVRAKGGNYLLNTGPNADGQLGLEDTRILGAIGKWMRSCGEAFEQTLPCSGLTVNPDIVMTRRGNILYVILYREPTIRSVPLKPIDCLPMSAVLLNTGAEVDCRLDLLPWDHTEETAYLRIYNLPLNVLNQSVPVIRLEFNEDFARQANGGLLEER